jgi:hypothetical protein
VLAPQVTSAPAGGRSSERATTRGGREEVVR